MHRPARPPGTAQRRQRQQMQQRGWSSITTYITEKNKGYLKQIQQTNELPSLHEALDLVLNQSALEQKPEESAP